MRIFTFGCSLTQYFYPTWADIVIKHFEEKYNATGTNWGKSGAGNQYIASKVMEANAIHKFNSDDIVLIQWTSMYREDRYHEDKGWYCPGGFGDRNVRTEKFILNAFEYEDEMQWADYLHCTMRDCALISSVTKALKYLGCKVYTTGFRGFTEGFENFNNFQEETLLTYENIGAILEQYKDDIKLDIEPILTSLEFGTDDNFFNSRPKVIPILGEEYMAHYLPEIHPLPDEHKKFVLDYVFPVIGESVLGGTANELVLEYTNKIKDKNPIVLKDLKWANTYQLGFSDDGWRP